MFVLPCRTLSVYSARKSAFSHVCRQHSRLECTVYESAWTEANDHCMTAGSKAVPAIHAESCNVYSRRNAHWFGNLWLLQVSCAGLHCTLAVLLHVIPERVRIRFRRGVMSCLQIVASHQEHSPVLISCSDCADAGARSVGTLLDEYTWPSMIWLRPSSMCYRAYRAHCASKQMEQSSSTDAAKHYSAKVSDGQVRAKTP